MVATKDPLKPVKFVLKTSNTGFIVPILFLILKISRLKLKKRLFMMSLLYAVEPEFDLASLILFRSTSKVPIGIGQSEYEWTISFL